MSYFYVKSGFGTRTTGGGTTKQTGSFATLGAANVYAKIEDAITDGAGGGDIVACSDLHAYAAAGNITYAATITSSPILFVSVDDTNCDQEKAGAKESANTSSTIFLNANLYIKIDLDPGYYMDWSENAQIAQVNSSASWGGYYSDYFLAGSSTWEKTNVTVDLYDGDSGSNVYSSSGGLDYMFGGSLIASNNGHIAYLHQNHAGYYATHYSDYTGVDLSAIKDTTLGLGYFGTDLNVVYWKNIFIKLRHCKVDSTFKGLSDVDPTSIIDFYGRYNSSNDSDAAEYQFEEKRRGGLAEDDIAIWREESTPFSGGMRVCVKVTTTANTTIWQPFYFDLLSQYAELSNASTDTVRIYFATLTSTADLTDQNVWAEMIYRDGTNKQTPIFLSNRNTDLLATGTAHTTDSGSDWQSGTQGSGTGLTTYDEHYMDLDTSGDPGCDQVPTIRIYVGEPSIIVHFDSTIGFVA